MVLLTITPFIMEGLTKRNESLEGQAEDSFAEGEEQPGKPISHEQLVRLWKALEGSGYEKYSLEALLRGTKVYTPPCPPKPEPVSLAGLSKLRAYLTQATDRRIQSPHVSPPPRRGGADLRIHDAPASPI